MTRLSQLRALLDDFENPPDGSLGYAIAANERLLVALRNAAPAILRVLEAAQSFVHGIRPGNDFWEPSELIDALTALEEE